MALSNKYEAYSDADAFLMTIALAQRRRALLICLLNSPVGCVIVQRDAIVSGRTPSCAHSLLKSGLRRMFVAMVDLERRYAGAPLRSFDCNTEAAYILSCKG